MEEATLYEAEEATLYKMVNDGKTDFLLYQKKIKLFGITLYKRFVHVPKFNESYDSFGIPYMDSSDSRICTVNSMNTALNLFVIRNVVITKYLKDYTNSVNAHEERRTEALMNLAKKRSLHKYFRNGVELTTRICQ